MRSLTIGCGSSRPDPAAQPARRAHRRTGNQQEQMVVSLPSGGLQMVPPQYRDTAGHPITHQDFELDRNTLTQALDHMGQYLDQQGITARAVTVGGAVNTIYLQSRESTHDVDFFMEDSQSPIHQAIHEAARSAARSSFSNSGVRLEANWFNNATQIMMGGDIQTRLASDAIQQNAIVHQYRGQRGGLIIYAAPWAYAFCGKLNRLCNPDPRPYDIRDAVVYLHEYLRASNRQRVTRGEILGWCHEYRKNVTDAVLDQVDNQYQQTYMQQVIVRQEAQMALFKESSLDEMYMRLPN